MANDINKEDPHYKGEYGSIYEVNRKFPTGGVAGDFVVIDGWAHYWNAGRGTWCVNAERDSYWDELITNIIEKFKLVRGATYMGVASLDTVPTKVIGAKMYYFATAAGTYKKFDNLVVPQGINVLYSENGSSWVNTTLLEVAQELGVSTNKVVSQKTVSDKLSDLGSKVSDLSDNVSIKDEEGMVVKTPFRYIQNEEFIFAKVDAEDKLLFGIQWDGTPVFGKTSAVEDRLQSQVTLLAEKVATIMGDEDTTNVIDTMNELKTFFTNIENTQSLTDILANLDNVAKNLDKTTIKDEEGMVVKTPFRYIQNEEFIFAKVDANDKLLFGIEWDGTPRFGKTSAVEDRLQEQVTHLAERVATIMGDEDTTNVIDTMNELKTFFANIENTQSLTDILANLDNVAKNLDKTTIKDEEGNVQDTPFRVIENEEFLKAIVDAEDRVLFGFYRTTGEPYYPLNEMYHVIQNKEYFAACLDEDDKVVLGIRRDGEIIGEIHAVNALKKVISQLQSDLASLQEKVGTIDANLKELLDVFSFQENPEYMAVEKDADGKVLSATYNDGSHYSHNLKSETIDAKVDKEEGKSLINEDVADAHSAFEDPEGRTEITTDADDKVISYRDADGKKHEHDMEVTNLDVSHLNLQGNSVNDISNALKATGFDIKGKTDWSDWYDKHDSALELPIPTKAVINITGVNQMPSKKLVNDKAYIEFFDFAGNYFKIKAYLNAQGASTMADPMKSCAIDLFSDDWGGNEFEIKFGDWVSQDGFHLKAFYKDSLKSIQPICYEIGEQIISFLNVRSNRFHISSDNVLIGGTGDMDNDVSQAKCMPSQFPCEVYLNGEYYGLFIWSLKKNRKNYSMNKKDYTSILIDNVGGMFNGDSFNWISAEIRNPKKLICVDGEEYDADTHMGELIGTDTVAGQQYTFSKLNAATTGTDTFKVTSVDYNAANKDMVNTAKAKAIIEACQAYKSEVNSASTNEEKKKIVEKSFDVDNLLAYIIFCELTYNKDGLYNNAQITIYDKKVGYNIYDCDSCLGKAWNGVLWTSSLSMEIFDSNSTNPLFIIKSLYAEEIGTMYKTLRDKGIITKENLNKIVDDWFDRLGTDTLKRSVTKWNNSPSYRNPTNLDEHWEPYIPLSKSELESINSYNAETNYSVGTIVCYCNSRYESYYYKCVKESLGSTPTTDGNYYTNGMYDSKERIKMWIEKRIDFCDILWNYK